MKKMIALMLLMSLLSVSCNDSGNLPVDDLPDAVSDTPGVTPDENSPVPDPDSTLPELALTWDTNVTLYDFTVTQEEKYNQAVALVKKVVGTEKFRNMVLSHTYDGVKQFSSTSMTNVQVYQSVLDAAEKLTPAKNNTMDVGVKLYYENNSVVGWTNGSITYFNVNTKFFNQYDIHQVAGNLFHEWLHKLGYGHDSSATARRPYSVPYAVGYMIRDIGKSFL